MRRLRFLHIPKCAGITFVTVLRMQYPFARRFSFSGELPADRRRWEALDPDKRGSIRLFTGHAPIETGVPEADNDVDVITMLREPVSRVQSFCQHVAEGKSPHLIERFAPASFDLDAFLDSGNEGLSNLQTRMLINRGRAAAPDTVQSLSPDEAVALALRNLEERIACFGILERFEESLVLFQQRLGWRTPCYASSNHRDPGRLLQFRDRHLTRIADMNTLDRAVYDAARQRFAEHIDSGRFDAAKLRRLRAVQPWASPLMKGLVALSGLRRTRSRAASPGDRTMGL